jgi:hypothetical protein
VTYTIGIDLGTTHSTLAFTQENGEIQQFQILQQITDDMEAKKGSLPSFFFIPKGAQKPYVGWYAKERGGELPDQVIRSAKSWLCHDMIDRRIPFLPLSESPVKKNPIDVSAAFLSHLRLCWEKEYPQFPLRQQQVVVTVPASFDPSARALVEEATQLAGFPEVRLIEEPLAAFYAWLYTHVQTWREHLKVGDTVLIVDVGGGTTDFSLIAVEEAQGDLVLERKAVGNHLLLGGDNIDLALAHIVQKKLSTELDEWQFQSLIHSCREAKESLLGENPPTAVNLNIQGRGSQIIGGSISVPLTKEEIEEKLVEGFFPRISLEEPIYQEVRSAIAKIGLPYARDPRISAQLAHFLLQSGCPLPTAVLFNGGTMKAKSFQIRILSLLNEWGQQEIKNLAGGDLENGVSRGAAYYGWSRLHRGIRVKAATCRSYFIGIESSSPAIPGIPPSIKKVRLVPFGMEEGSEMTLEDQTFALLLDEPAVFRFYSQNSPSQDDLKELHLIETLLHSQGEEGKIVWVKLKAKVTELGVLELWCIAQDGRKWKLEFDIRKH